MAEAEEGGEDVEAEFIELGGGFGFEEGAAGVLEFGEVVFLLGAFEGADEVFFDAVWEVGGDFFFGAPEEEGADAGAEAAAGVGVVFGIEVFGEGGAVPEDAGHGKGHDGPEVEEAVFDGGAAEGEAVTSG